jgi:hypothetical protein
VAIVGNWPSAHLVEAFDLVRRKRAAVDAELVKRPIPSFVLRDVTPSDIERIRKGPRVDKVSTGDPVAAPPACRRRGRRRHDRRCDVGPELYRSAEQLGVVSERRSELAFGVPGIDDSTRPVWRGKNKPTPGRYVASNRRHQVK